MERDTEVGVGALTVISRGAQRLTAARALVLLIVGGTALAIGGVHPEVVLGLGVASIALLLVSDQEWHPFAWALMGLGAWCLVQVIPLPLAVVQVLSPHSAEIWSRAVLTGVDPGLVTLSADPGATLVEAAKWCSYAALAACARPAFRGLSSNAHLRVIVGVAFLVALVTLLHGLVDAKRLYGFYEPDFKVRRWSVSPLLNANSLAGYLNFSVFVGAGLLLRARGVQAWIAGLGTASILSLSLLTGSRGGLASLVVGAGLCGLVAAYLAFTRRRISLRIAGLGGAMALAVALVLLAAPPTLLAESFARNADKLRVLEWSTPLLGDFPVFGVGRGAFASTFPFYDSARRDITFVHAENFLVEWMAGWGIPVAIAAVVMLGRAFRPKMLRFGKSLLGTCTFAGVVALAVQNLFDLGFEIPAIAVVLVLVGSLTGNRPALSTATRAQQLSTLVLGCLLLVGLCGTLLVGRHTLQRDRRDLTAQYRGLEEVGWSAFRAEALSAIKRHPADPYLPRIAGFAAYRARQDPMPWISHSLERDVNGSRTHLLLARVLASRGLTNQAMLELRLAATSEPDLAEHAGTQAVGLSTDPQVLERAAPEGPAGARILLAMARAVDPKDAEAAQSLMTLAAERGGAGERLALVDYYLSRVEQGKAPCQEADRLSCLSAAEKHIARLDQQSPEARVRKALIALLSGKPRDVGSVLQVADCRGKALVSCYLALFRADLEIENPASARKLGDELLALVCMDRAECARQAEALGNVAAKADRPVEAMAYLNRAAREQPSGARYRRLADACMQARAHGAALDAWERADRLEGHADPGLRRRIELERRRLMAPNSVQ